MCHLLMQRQKKICKSNRIYSLRIWTRVNSAGFTSFYSRQLTLSRFSYLWLIIPLLWYRKMFSSSKTWKRTTSILVKLQSIRVNHKFLNCSQLNWSLWFLSSTSKALLEWWSILWRFPWTKWQKRALHRKTDLSGLHSRFNCQWILEMFSQVIKLKHIGSF